MAADPQKRRKFVLSSLAFLTQHGFDGFLLHWGPPQSRARARAREDKEYRDKDKADLVSLLKELKEAFAPSNLTISLVMWQPLASKLDTNFDVAAVYRHVELVFVNAFHYHGHWFERTGGFAPLYASTEDEAEQVPWTTASPICGSWEQTSVRLY